MLNTVPRTLVEASRSIVDEMNSSVVLTVSGGCRCALDNFCGASDFVAFGFQFARGRRSDPLAAGCGISGFGHQLVERPPNRGLTGPVTSSVDYFSGG